ncbi:hypothetical protein L210DRAFT_3492395 [Boletus edulis BED1]|uniref:Prolyl 4-hydroxylase alpha subunit domain-containing protein n=1 Tax=Boletus edulis BED1 TaxID=1328754 RepID=A0AAD4G5W0_BOLED|nr:hypothetical protein L210DRAFT_3492395 [Boletus edulis BED1]
MVGFEPDSFSIEEAWEGSDSLGEENPIENVTKAQSRLQRRKKAERARVRARKAEESGIPVKQVAWTRRSAIVQTNAVVSTEATEVDLKVAEGGWVGSQKKAASKPSSDVQTLLDKGFRLIKWDGREPKAIVDKVGRVIAVLAGMPGGSFQEAVTDATAAFEAQGQRLASEGGGNLRGQFHQALAGFSHGGGTERPTATSSPTAYSHASKALSSNPAVIRLACFQNQAFKTYFPATHTYYETKMLRIKQHHPSLKFPFVDAFPSAAFNMGPQTVCKPHKDARNLAFGLCPVTALGDFDHQKGGHLVLEELELVVEFPSGSTALIPSAVITHSNTTIGTNEKRYSFTQYASGTLFSYVENGMCTDKEFLREASKKQKAEWKGERELRWAKGLALFPFIDSYQ